MGKIPPILYAEDNENDVELTLTAFRECKLQNRIDVVYDGQQVIDYLTYHGKFNDRPEEKPVVILLDIKMPKMDGIQALKIIKSDENLKTIPVVMLTSSSMEKDLIESYNLGVNAYVVKPVDFTEFLEAVKKIGFFWALINKTV
ncbi:MAG: response regulator [Bacteroidales bacterium]|nr:response regulator [Bacteroidales bacterium]